jgi:hypothetical protein
MIGTPDGAIMTIPGGVRSRSKVFLQPLIFAHHRLSLVGRAIFHILFGAAFAVLRFYAAGKLQVRVARPTGSALTPGMS